MAKKPSLPVRGAWIEIHILWDVFPGMLSLPVRGAWIEIKNVEIGTQKNSVAPRKGSVD